MACWTQQEIAEATGVTKETVSEVCQKSAKLPESDKAAAAHATDFQPPIYNTWKQRERTPVIVGRGEVSGGRVEPALNARALRVVNSDSMGMLAHHIIGLIP